MRHCDKCLDNNWNFRFIDGWIRATCNQCSYEVEFPAKKRKKVVGTGKSTTWEMRDGGVFVDGEQSFLIRHKQGKYVRVGSEIKPHEEVVNFSERIKLI